MQIDVKVKKAVIFTAMLLITALSVIFAGNKHYTIVCMAILILSCEYFFGTIERESVNARYFAVIAVMTSLSVVGRFIFAPIPGFKPIASIVILTGVYFSAEAGFLVGSLSALISNMYFGHGPWTPFQMLGWGLVGLLAGWLAPLLKSKNLFLIIYGAFAGIFFSVVMEIWSTVWYSPEFNISMFLTLFYASVPFTVLYSASNMLFLKLTNRMIGRKLERVVKLINRSN